MVTNCYHRSFIKADSSTVSSGTFTVRNVTSNTFELLFRRQHQYGGSNTESVVFSHTILVLTNVKGLPAGEVIRNDDSSHSVLFNQTHRF